MPQTNISGRNYRERRPARSRKQPVPPVPPREEEWIEEPSPELRKIIDEALERIHSGDLGVEYTTMEDLIIRAMNQNFVPLIDDRGIFIGIITRGDIIRSYYDESSAYSKRIQLQVV